jgi:hypothetical protein
MDAKGRWANDELDLEAKILRLASLDEKKVKRRLFDSSTAGGMLLGNIFF